MKTIVIREAGGPDVLTLTDVPQPEPRAGEVLIKVAAAAVNRPDVFQRMGVYPPPKGARTFRASKWLARSWRQGRASPAGPRAIRSRR